MSLLFCLSCAWVCLLPPNYTDACSSGHNGSFQAVRRMRMSSPSLLKDNNKLAAHCYPLDKLPKIMQAFTTHCQSCKTLFFLQAVNHWFSISPRLLFVFQNMIFIPYSCSYNFPGICVLSFRLLAAATLRYESFINLSVPWEEAAVILVAAAHEKLPLTELKIHRNTETHCISRERQS